MAYLQNSIGANLFASLTGPINYTQEAVELIERAGVDGTGLRKLGTKNKPSQLVSRTYHASFAAAGLAVSTTYSALVGASPVAVIRNGVNHGNFAVLEVREIETFPVMNATGNAPVGATVCQLCAWTIL